MFPPSPTPSTRARSFRTELMRAPFADRPVPARPEGLPRARTPARRAGGRPDSRPVARHHAGQPADPGGAVRRAQEAADRHQLGDGDRQVRGRLAQVQRRARLALGAAAAPAPRRAAQPGRGPRRPQPILGRCGEEMLVITNPSTLAAANTFANAKRAQGMRTSVVQTGAGAGHIGNDADPDPDVHPLALTAENCIHPSYVTILGDDELVPTFPGIGGIESDLEYSLKDRRRRDVGRRGRPDRGRQRLRGRQRDRQDHRLRERAAGRRLAAARRPSRRSSRTTRPRIRTRTGRSSCSPRLRATGYSTRRPAFGLTVDRIYATYPIGAVDPSGTATAPRCPPS